MPTTTRRLPVAVDLPDGRVGLWIELEATIGFIVGLGLASLLGQRTVAVILSSCSRSS